jgi:acetamidase/formamidase
MTEKIINREHATVTEFGAHLEPLVRVNPGELFRVETQDNFFGLINKEDVLPTPERLEILRHQHMKVNPVAGPIHVEGLKAGDLLVLEIDDIIPLERGWTGIMPPFGNLSSHTGYPELQKPFSRICHHRPGPSGTTSDGTGMFKVTREVIYPLRPFLGTVVTAPERGIENTLVSQGPWGGNLDCKHVCRGNKIMLNTAHDGGLLYMGDAHGAQADSEYTGLADECAVDVLARCQIVEQKKIPGVCRIESPDSIIQVDTARNAGNMERALNGAFWGMADWLVKEHGLDSREVYLQFSVNPDVIVHTYQFVSGFYTVGVEFPKKYL